MKRNVCKDRSKRRNKRERIVKIARKRSVREKREAGRLEGEKKDERRDDEDNRKARKHGEVKKKEER